jgi:hypothetical protein
MPTRSNRSTQRKPRKSGRADAGAAARVSVTITTCKRLALFLKTMESFLQHCKDHDRVTEWLCVDDNSSADDRRQMAERFPFFRFVFKDADQKGHARSMNLILDQVRSRFVLHLEDDWDFARDFRIADLLAVLADGRYQQVVLCPRPGGVPFGKTGDGLAIEQSVYNPDHPVKPEPNRRYDAIFPARRPGGEGGWWWPGFSLNPGIFDIEFFRSRVGRFDERIDRALFEYDYARRAYEAGAAILSVDCGLRHLGAVSASAINDQPPRSWETTTYFHDTAASNIVEGNTHPKAEESEPPPSSYLIPNNVHFLYLHDERGFTFCNFLAILSARVVQKPEAIYLHYDRPPRMGPWWEAAKRYVMLVPRQPPAEYGGIRLRGPRQQADVLRFQILAEQGGIFLGTDVITLKPYNPLRTYTCVLGGESYTAGRCGLFSADLDQIATLTSAVLMSAPGNSFFARCLEQIPYHIQAEGVADQAGVDLHRLARGERDRVHLEPVESFVPFDCETDELFRDADQGALDDLFARKLSRAYCIYLWQAAWRERFLDEIDEAYLTQRKNLIAAFFKGYLLYLDSDPRRTIARALP